MKRKNPPTSLAAHDSVKDAKPYYHAKIIEGLKRLKVGGTYEEIAAASGIKPEQSWRRLSELIKMGIVFNAGYTRKTSSGRAAEVRQLVGLTAIPTNPEPKTEKQKSANKIVQTINQGIKNKQLSLL